MKRGRDEKMSSNSGNLDHSKCCSPVPRIGRHKVIQFKNVRIIRGGQLVRDDLWVQDGKVLNPQSRFWTAHHCKEFLADTIIDGKNAIISPGFIDLQINGGFGIDFTSSSEDNIQRGLEIVGSRLLQYGCTLFLPTVITSQPEVYHKLLPKLAPFKACTSCAGNFGVHVEGPFINRAMKGAHDENAIRSPVNAMDSINECYESLENVKLITMAPELHGSLESIPKLSEKMVVSIGHSAAPFEVAAKSVDAGATLITHLFNAMSPFHHRDPGLIGLLGTTERQIKYSIIVDGIHAHPSSVKIAYQAFPDGAVLVTDAMSAMGLPPGKYNLGAKEVVVSEDRAETPTGPGKKSLAGAIATLDQCVRNFKKFTGCSIVEAVESVTLRPAELLGIQKQKGTLEFGADADLVLMDDDMNLQSCWVGGELAWERSPLK